MRAFPSDTLHCDRQILQPFRSRAAAEMVKAMWWCGQVTVPDFAFGGWPEAFLPDWRIARWGRDLWF